MMRFFRLFALLLAMIAVMPAAHAAGRTVLINTDAFYNPQDGIPALLNAMNLLNNEFKPVSNEIAAMNTKISIEEKALAAAVAANDSAAATTHNDNLVELNREAKLKSDDAAQRVEKRRQALVGPIEAKVVKAMSAYATAKGIDVILDANSSPLYLSPTWQQANDVTADFITWYKAQPAN